MKVVFFHRKPHPDYNFSVENLFKTVREALPSGVTPIVKQVAFHSTGVINRVLICLQAVFSQGDVNHVTGDINFVTIFLRKRRTLLTVLDVGFMNHPKRVSRFILRLLWIAWPVRRAGIVTTISKSTKAELLKYVSINPAKVRVVYVPILPDFLPQPKQINKSKPVILQIGTKGNKNVIRLVQALRGLNCQLSIVGSVPGDLKEELEKYRIEYTAQSNLTNSAVIQKYVEADIISFVSTYEGFGMPIVEANAVGRVVVTSNILSMPEVGADAAHFVDPYSVDSIRAGMVKVIEDDSYRENLILNGYKNRKRFDASEIASQYASLYHEMVKGETR
jgi:glycosyltransferase involved in cell wall biosynthesis